MTTVLERPWRLKVRHAWLVPGVAVAVAANALATEHGLGLGPLLLFGIAPHLTVLAGIGQQHERGQLARRAVPLFNTMHNPVVPTVVLALAVPGILAPFWLAGALAWLGHILVDLALGDGMRTAEGWQRRSWV